ncbi:hypothetical protein LRU_00828 [Ligilactobacillus ruminis SPM0211]|uniref:Uncharacterized protein n=1 Tax=Ligilactobacillus ruminis SPM0211 TaxID=1040964 RepID=F7QZH2_9LACO|nr:hypothetical protein LRU_00828 [Ligilactobacillus ruminis SPM0211]
MSSTAFKKSRTKSIANRPLSFGFSFNSSKKRDFFQPHFLCNAW